MTDHVLTALVLSAAIGAASFITSTAKVSAPARVWVAKHKGTKGTRQFTLMSWLFDLLMCHFCTATWMSLVATAVYRPWLVRLFLPLDYLVTALAITGLSTLTVLVIRRSTWTAPSG